MTASPMNFSTVPPKRSMSALTRSWYGRRVARTSSGSARSERSVKPTRSTNRTETTFRSSPAGASRGQRLPAGEAETCSLRVLLAAVRAGQHVRIFSASAGSVYAAGGSGSSSSSASRRCSTLRESTPTSRWCSSTTGTRSASSLEEVERLVERDVRVDREVRRLGDGAELRLLRVEPVRDDLAHERLARDDADEPLVVVDVDRAHLRSRQQLSGLLRRRVGRQRARVRDHRVADGAHG